MFVLFSSTSELSLRRHPHPFSISPPVIKLNRERHFYRFIEPKVPEPEGYVKYQNGVVKKRTCREMSFIAPEVNPVQPKVFGVKFSLREIRRIFYSKIRYFKLFKMPKL